MLLLGITATTFLRPSLAATDPDPARQALDRGAPDEALALCLPRLRPDDEDPLLLDLACEALARGPRDAEADSLLAVDAGPAWRRRLARAGLLYWRGRWEEAGALYRDLIDTGAGPRPQTALLAGLRLGGTLHRLRRNDEAAAVLRRTRALAPPPGDGATDRVAGEVEVLLATVLELEGGRKEALGILAAVADAAAARGDAFLEGRALNNQGAMWAHAGDHAAAARLYGQAAEVARGAGHPYLEMLRLRNAAESCADLGSLDEAATLLVRARRLARSLDRLEREAQILASLARVARLRGDPAAAVALCDTVLAQPEGVELPGAVGLRVREIQGNALLELGRVREALSVHEEARRTQRLSRRGAAMLLNNLGNCYLALGRPAQARSHYEEALALSRELDEPPRIAVALANVATCLAREGRPQEALDAYREAAACFDSSGSRLERARVHMDMATVQQHLGRGEEALGELERGLSLLAAEGSRYGLARGLVTLARVQRDLGHAARARAALEEAVDVARAAGSRDEPVDAWLLLCDLEMAEGRLEAAAAWLAEAERFAADGVPPRTRGLLELGRARIALAGEDARAARDALERSRTLLLPYRIPTDRVDLEWTTARALEASGRDDAAWEHYRVALETVEEVRRGAVTEPERWAVLGRYVDLLAEAAWFRAGSTAGAADAFAVAERGRARTFAEVLARTGVDLAAQAPRDLVDERRECLARHGYAHSRLRTALDRGETARADSLAAVMDSLDHRILDLEGRIARRSGEEADLAAATPAELAALLPDRGLFLEYLEAPDGVLCFTVDAQGALEAHRLPRVADAVEDFLARVRAGRRPRDEELPELAAAARHLCAVLLDPILAAHGTVGRLVVAPDGSIGRVPFEALLAGPARGDDPSRWPWLFRRHEILYVPSARVWSALARRPATPTADRPVLVLADPLYPSARPAAARGLQVAEDALRRGRGYDFGTLPHSRSEAAAVAGSLSPVLLLTGSAATEDTIKALDLRRFGRIHLAAHAVVDEAHPLVSSVVLSLDEDPAEDGFLTLREIRELRLDGSRVVLSACRSGGGPRRAGEGVIGLVRPFLVAGARSGVVSLWSVDDRSTAAFMEAYYAALTGGADESAALAGARNALLHGPRPAWRLPWHWAAFVLVGLP
jgi:CHAT domain-containing protein